MAFIDYGAVVIKNGAIVNSEEFFQEMKSAVGWELKDVKGNYFAYIGDKNITIGFYKTSFVLCNENGLKKKIWANFENKKSFRYQIGGANIHIKNLCGRDLVYLCSMDYKGDHYHVVFGYGIDSDANVWNRVKEIYLGKRASRIVDNTYKKYIK